MKLSLSKLSDIKSTSSVDGSLTTAGNYSSVYVR